MSTIKLEGVTKVFGGNVYACKDISLDIEDGEFLVVLGPSGSGKTTLLRIIAGLERPTRGRVYIDGVDVTDLPPRKRDVAMVFQTWALYPHMKVYDNIAFPLKVKGLQKEEVRRRVKEVAEVLGIDHLLDRYPRQLSGGQQQRVALARALVRNPKAWLMDEPLSNLDAILRVQMRVELKRLQRSLGITTVYVTHDQVEAMSMADRIAVMNEGEILQAGTPLEIYEKPSTVFVGGFIGSPPMNFIKARVVRPGGGLHIDLGGGQLARLGESLADILQKAEREEVIIGFRPEHASIGGMENQGIEISGEVDIIEHLGSDTIVNVRVGRNIIKIKVAGPINVGPGSKVTIGIEESKIRLFDPLTGKLLK